MSDKAKLYETLGELLYVIAMADGVIQDEEKKVLQEITETHQWAHDIKWSFNYEESKKADVENVYKKVIDFCHNYGPAPEYQEFIEAMNKLASAAEGIDESESMLINSFSRDLTERFRNDIERKLNRDLD